MSKAENVVKFYVLCNKLKNVIRTGMSWSEMWLVFGQKKYNYAENFQAVSNYALNNNINSLKK